MFNSIFTKKDPVADVVSKIIEEGNANDDHFSKQSQKMQEAINLHLRKGKNYDDAVTSAKKQVKESWDDDEDDDVKRADAELKRMKAKPIHADKKTDPDKEIGKLAKKTPKEVDEEVEQIGEISGDLALKYKNNALGGKSIDDVSPKRQSGVTLAHRKVSQSITNVPGRHAKVAATWKEESEQIDELSKDTLGSYVKKSSDAADKHLKLANSAAQRSKTAADTKQFLKHSEKFGKRTSGLKMAVDGLNKEEAVSEDKWTDIADGPWKKSNRTPGQAASAAANAAGKGLKSIKDMKKKEMKKEEAVSEDKWTDIAAGNWKKSNRSTSSAISAAANAAGKGLKGTQHKLDVAEPKGKLTGADFKKLRKEDAEQIDEKNWIAGAIKKPGALHKQLHVPADEKIPVSKLASASHKGGKLGQRARLAVTLKKMHHEEVEQVNESHYGDMSHAAKELVLHADNDVHLHHTSHAPIMHNLSKKMKNGTYHPEKAKKLWAYHADRAAQSYAKHHGDGTPWHKMFSTSDRKAAASHWEDMHRHQLNETIEEAKGPTSTYGLDTFAQEDSVTPLSRVKQLARHSMTKIKNEMLGKAGATSEEVDPSVKTTDTLKGRVKGGDKDDVGPGSDAKSTKIKFTPGPK